MPQLDRSVVVDLGAARRARPALSLALLGDFALRADGEPVALPAGAQRLVALLALRGRTSRSRLAGTLWPETTEHRALASLRTGIWRVNQAAERVVVCSGTTLDLGADVEVDVRRDVDGALGVLRAGPGDEVDLREVSEGGELLADWEDDWLVADRERLRQIRLHRLEAVAGRLAAAGRYGLALEAALAALRMDALRESAYRTVIGIHLAEGNVAEARRAYALCHQVLAREVGVEPTAATAALLPPPRSVTALV